MQHGRLAGPVSAMSEIHMHYEHPFRFVYHTLRWLSVRPATTLHAAVKLWHGWPVDQQQSSFSRRLRSPETCSCCVCCKGVLVVVQDEEDKEDIGVEVMLTAEDAAAGFRLPMPLLQM